jgi:hypothetical protein
VHGIRARSGPEVGYGSGAGGDVSGVAAVLVMSDGMGVLLQAHAG